MFKKYEKIISLEDFRGIPKEEVEGILDGKCYIWEKIDGANLSIWMEDWEIFVWSRNTVVWTWEIKSWFRGAVEYINNHKGIKKFLNKYPNYRIYWEWLVPHTITDYNKDAYNNFYMFDIEDYNGEKMWAEELTHIAQEYEIKIPELFDVIENPTIESLQKFIWKTSLGKRWEGIVIKNYSFVNKFWDKVYAKIVSPSFKEEAKVVFGNHWKNDVEGKINDAFCTLGRLKKIVNKKITNEGREIERSDIWTLIHNMQYDIIVEEAWIIQERGVVNFKRLKSLIAKRTARMLTDLFNGNEESIAFNKEKDD